MVNATELVYEKIREGIIYGEYPSGSPLGEVELSERYQMSRTPIREALKRLAGEGLVASRRRGLAVKKYSRAEISEVYDLRALLEGYGAALAAKRAAPKQLAKLREHNGRYEEAVRHAIAGIGDDGHARRIKSVIEENSLFHGALLAYAGNDRLNFLASKVMVLPLVFRSFYWCDAHELRTSCRAHELLLMAISDGDTERARSAMTEHIYLGRDYVLMQLDGASS